MRKILFFILIIGFLFAKSQVIDDFSDGNISQEPAWQGNMSDFQVNTSGQLQLNAEGTGTSYLWTSNSLIDSTEWNFWIKLSFSPSSNNNAKIYLASDKSDLGENLNGYYLQMGESGSVDAIELFRQSGSSVISVCRGTDGFISGSFSINVKVTRKSNGEWKIYIDSSGDNNYLLDATGNDNTINESQYFGVYCTYTSSNSTKFYFDNILFSRKYSSTVL